MYTYAMLHKMLKLYEVTTCVYFPFPMICLDMKKKIWKKIKYPQYNLRYYMQGHNSLNTFSLEYWLGLANAHRI